MATDEIEDQIEDQIGLTQPDAFEETTTGTSVTGKHIFADGGDGKEKEVNIRNHQSGASSEAPASSGIPSAEKQHDIAGKVFDKQKETPMADHVQPATQNTQ